jgi:hypothetical protein
LTFWARDAYNVRYAVMLFDVTWLNMFIRLSEECALESNQRIKPNSSLAICNAGALPPQLITGTHNSDPRLPLEVHKQLSPLTDRSLLAVLAMNHSRVKFAILTRPCMDADRKERFESDLRAVPCSQYYSKPVTAILPNAGNGGAFLHACLAVLEARKLPRKGRGSDSDRAKSRGHPAVRRGRRGSRLF